MKNQKINKKVSNRRLFLRKVRGFLIFFVYIFLFNFLFFSTPTLAHEAVKISDMQEMIDEIAEIDANKPEIKIINQLPENEDREVIWTSVNIVTAYNSEEAQCDDTPCITANGFNLCEANMENSIAANFLPLGEEVRMPELFGDKVFVVRDRMNPRYIDRIDIWMKEKVDAKQFGVKRVKIEVLR